MTAVATTTTTETTFTPSTGGTTWTIDPAHSEAQFSVRHLMISNVRGAFRSLAGTLALDDDDITRSRIDAAIDVASIETREPGRDAHLRSADFFDADRYPSITFHSRAVERTPAGLAVRGDLTIRGVTRPVVLDVEGPTPPVRDPWGNVRIGLSARTRINRGDFGLTWNAVLEAGGLAVSDEVRIELEVELVRS